jgi:hypothetical protein
VYEGAGAISRRRANHFLQFLAEPARLLRELPKLCVDAFF